MPIVPVFWAVTAIAGLFAVSSVAENSADLVDKATGFTKQATIAGAIAGGVYLVYLGNKKGLL